MHSRLTFITWRLIHRLLLNKDFVCCFWPPHLSCIHSHSTHCQALWTTVNILTVSNGEKYDLNTDPKVNYATYSSEYICNNGETKGEPEHHYIFINSLHSCTLFRSNSSWDWALYSSANAADVDSKSRGQYGLTERCLWETIDYSSDLLQRAPREVG